MPYDRFSNDPCAPNGHSPNEHGQCDECREWLSPLANVNDSTRIGVEGEGNRSFVTLDGKPAKTEASGLYVIVSAEGVPDCRVPYQHYNAAIGAKD